MKPAPPATSVVPPCFIPFAPYAVIPPRLPAWPRPALLPPRRDGPRVLPPDAGPNARPTRASRAAWPSAGCASLNAAIACALVSASTISCPGCSSSSSPAPPIGQDRRGTSGRFEQAHRRRPAGRDHVGAGDVQRHARCRIEIGVIHGREMIDPLDVGGPIDLGGILRAGDDEPLVRQRPRRRDQQAFQRRLAIGAVSAEVGKVPALGDVPRLISVGIHRAIERARRRHPELMLDARQRRPARER